MFTNLVDDAKKEGMHQVHVCTLIQNQEGKVLLIENLERGNPFFMFPTAAVKQDESIQQALHRAVGLETGMEVAEVKRYLGHYDRDQERFYHFVVGVKDPYAIESNNRIAHAWLEVQEAVGYPIKDEMREMLDLFAKESS